MQPPVSAQQWKAKANRARAVAVQMTNQQAKQMMLRIADHYDFFSTTDEAPSTTQAAGGIKPMIVGKNSAKWVI